MGSASVVNFAIGLVRTKAMATMLGPAGIGLMSLFMAVKDLGTSLAGMGVESSAVRQVAAATGSDAAQSVARTVRVLRLLTRALAVFGAVVCALGAPWIARLTFGSEEQTPAVTLLSLAVACGVLAGGHNALLQGLRRIVALAKMSVCANALGALSSVLLVKLLGPDGIVPAIVVGAATSLLLTWLFARAVGPAQVTLSIAEWRVESAAMLRLGLAFMLSSLAMLGCAYAVRSIISRQLGLDAAGLYQAAWTLSTMYSNVLLGAMYKDYYPRLTSTIDDDAQTQRTVDDQVWMSMLLACPGMVATLVLAPQLISVLYTKEFVSAGEIVRWNCLGVAVQAITIPVGYILLARNAQKLFVGADLLWVTVNITLTWLLVPRHGTVGAGMAFFGAYLAHGTLVLVLARRVQGWRWSARNARGALGLLGLLVVLFVAPWVLAPAAALALGVTATVLCTLVAATVLWRQSRNAQAIT